MAKIEYGEYTAWTVNGTPRFMKNGKLTKAADVPQDAKTQMEALLEQAEVVKQTNGKPPVGEGLPIPEPREEVQPAPTLNPGLGEAPKQTIENDTDIDILKRQIEELKQSQAQWMNIASALTSGQQGGVQMSGNRLVGINEKFSTDKSHYPDPVQRLANEPRLQRFGIQGGPLEDSSFFLEYKFTETSYTDINNQRQKEPQFHLTLNRYIFDDQGYKSNKWYTVAKLVMHEDPDAAIAIAREQGLSIEMDDEKAFLDEMRYIRFRDWLFEMFFPPRVQETHTTEQIINNRPVKVFEASSENPQTIPFDSLRSR